LVSVECLKIDESFEILMKSRLILLPLLFAFLASFPVFAQTGTQTPGTVMLGDGQDKYSLGRNLEILRDPTGELTIQDVTSAGYQDQFHLSQVDTPNFGFQKAVYWVRFRALNQSKENSNWVLGLEFANMHYADLYLPSTDGSSYVVKKSGVMRPYENRDIPFHRLTFNLNIPPGDEQTVYLRFQSEASMTIPLVLWSSDAFTGFMLRDQLAYGLISGAMIIMALFNLLLWLLIRERTYLFLVMFIISQQCSNFIYRGVIYQFIQFNTPKVPTSLLLIFLGLEVFFVLRFVVELLGLRANSPKLYRGSIYYGAALILTVLLAPFGPYQLIGRIQLILGIVLFTAIIIVTGKLLRAGSRTARFLFVSWIWFIFTGILFALTRLGLLSSTPFTENSTQVALVWMVAVWSLALADRVNILKTEADNTSQRLSESEERFRATFERAAVGMANVSPTGHFIRINDRFCEIVGYSRDEMLAHSYQDITHPDDLEADRQQVDRLLRGEVVSSSWEKRYLHKGGKTVWVNLTTTLLREDTGEPSYFISVINDLTVHKQALQALEESETGYRRLVETMNEGLGVLDANDNLIYVNPRLAEMLGFPQNEMIGLQFAEFFDDENRKIVADKLTKQRAGEQKPYQITWCRKDGCDLHTLVTPAAVFDQSGKYLRSIAVVTDISEQVIASRLLDQRVAERTHELSTLLEVSRVVVSTLELEPLLQIILDQLKSVVDFNGAVIYSMPDRLLSTRNFPLLVGREKAMLLAETLMREFSQDERILRGEVIFIADLQADTEDGLFLRRTAADFLDISSTDMRSWMGIPLRFKNHLIGVLSVYHHHPDYYTPEDAHLAFAFANQAALAIENARLYRQAQVIAATEERSRLARELHDSVTQALYSLTLYAGATQAALHAGKLDVAEKNLDEVVEVAREGMGDLRLLIFELRPPILDEEGLLGALQTRLEAVERRAGIRTDFHSEGEPDLPGDVEKELYWSIHEALNNVLKHARAKNVSLDLQFWDGSATITLQDDGAGFDVSGLDQQNGMGLKNVADRVEKIGASLTIQSTPGEGTIFCIKLNHDQVD